MNLFETPDLALLELARRTLLDAGISCVVTHALPTGSNTLNDVTGFYDRKPGLWLHDAADAPRARALLNGLMEAPAEGEDWSCASCRDTVPFQLAVCPRCFKPDAA